MTLPDWRKPCSLGYYVAHFHWLGDAYMDCPGGSPITYADLEALGEKLDWCERHRATNTYKTSSHFCTIAVYQEAFEAVVFDCEMVERLLIPLPEQEVVK